MPTRYLKTALPLLILGVWGVIFHARTLGFRAFTTTTYALEKPGPLPRSAPSWSLSNQHGDRLSFTNGQAPFILYHFMYLHCSYVCGITFSYVQELHRNLEEMTPQRLLMVSVTVDPQRDHTRDLYDAWLSLNRPRGWMLARHENPETMNHDFKMMGVSHYRLPNGDFNHSAYFYLVDPRNNLIEVFDPAQGLGKISSRLAEIVTPEALP